MSKLPYGWQEVRIDSVAEVSNGMTPSRSEPRYWSNGIYPWLPTSKVHDRLITLADEFISQAALDECPIRIFPSGSVLVSMIGQGVTRGMAAYLTIDAAINQNFACITPRSAINGLFAFHFLDSQYEKLRNISQGSNQGSLNCSIIGSHKILLPPLLEQLKIAQILSTWDEAIALMEALIAALKDRKRGLMQWMLTGKVRFSGFDAAWDEQPIGTILEDVQRQVDVRSNKEYNLLSVRRRSEGAFFREKRIGAELNETMYEVRENDFLISKRQIVHGAAALATAEFEGFLVSNAYHTLQPRNGNSIRFFNWLSKTPYLYHLSYISSHGVHIEKLFFVIESYLKHRVNVPPSYDEQEKIADVLDSAEDLIQEMQSYQSVLREQKKGLMQRLLTGEVRVKVENK